MSARSTQPGLWLDPAAAAVPSAAAAWSGWSIGPLFDLPPGPASALAGLAMFGAGWGLMRGASPRSAAFALRTFRPPPEPDELLLDQPLAGPIGALAELLLDDPLPSPRPDSRVVQLFPAQPIPTAGELKRRIDVHLGLRADPDNDLSTGLDASDSLRRALDELRQTLALR